MTRRRQPFESSVMNKKKSIYDDIYAVVERIPRGRVATYGQIAILAGAARHARVVGYALNAMPEESDLPWHRVINARGQVSGRSAPGWENYQRGLLEAEGILFSAAGVVSLERFQWRPRRRQI